LGKREVKCSDLVPKRLILQHGQTIKEIAAESGLPMFAVRRIADISVKEGKWLTGWK
jgi:hypothetical protein